MLTSLVYFYAHRNTPFSLFTLLLLLLLLSSIEKASCLLAWL